MRTRPMTLGVVIATALLLTGCGGEDAPVDGAAPASPTSASSPASESEETEPEKSESAEPEPEGTVVVVTIKGDRVEPNGDRVEADLDEPVTLAVTSDRPGELHVHSTPEQVVEFEKGSGKYELTFEQPGVVAVEEHESGIVIVQLQVS